MQKLDDLSMEIDRWLAKVTSISVEKSSITSESVEEMHQVFSSMIVRWDLLAETRRKQKFDIPVFSFFIVLLQLENQHLMNSCFSSFCPCQRQELQAV